MASAPQTATLQVPPSPATDAQPRQRRNNGRGRGQSGRGGARGRPSVGSQFALRPASVAPSNTASQSEGHTQPSQGRARRGRGNNLVRPGRTSGAAIPTRQFGGTLTSGDDGESQNGQPSLQAEAREFTPGQTYQAGAVRPPRKQAPARPRRMSKSSAPDIATRVQEDIDNHQYECPICTSEVLRKSKVWSCHTCWTVFHLHCIKQWASNAGSQDQQPQNGQPPAPRHWRCPGCNLPQETKPSSYTCWCGKDHDPKSITGLPPHSCGQTCGKARALPKKCPHPCEIMCHAGPCPPCTHTGPKQSCFCGKEMSQKKCTETRYEDGWSCRQICGDIMPCGEHTCQRECHEGLCGACEVRIDARCYCGKEEKALLCADRDDDKACSRIYNGDGGDLVTKTWTGIFQCPETCERPFSCGIHTCQLPCHAQESTVVQCPRSPELVSHCPCGKTLLSEIIQGPRITCEDPIPNCKESCMKPLSCGHPCQRSCHIGPCGSCLEKVSISCRCGRTHNISVCHQGQTEAPMCPRICHTTLNCGRHECGEHCCSGERRALERQASKRKLRPLGAEVPRPVDDGFEAEHICTRVCGRPLKCGNHTCQELCHKGPCGSCLEAVFDEISCNCGRTVLQPPLPCGTRAPPCRYMCERPKACGHPQVAHNCHEDDEQCPKCPFLVEKSCVCGKKNLKNQQCWFEDVKCGEVCGRKLKCGSHSCRKTCHRPGDCEDAAGKCQQPCGKPKRTCDHPCEDQCHAPYPCKEDKPCPHKVIITCECQHKKKEMRCSASKDSEGNGSKSIECDDECARLERNRKLAVALNIDKDHTDDHIPYSQTTLGLFAESPKWSQEQERELRVFATSTDEKRLRFKPMSSAQRTFLHHLAEDFGFDSESMDPEPHRHVLVLKTPKFVSAPNKTLRDCVRIRQTQKAAAAEAQAKAKSSTIREPYNGLLILSPRFALTIDELETEIATVLGPVPRLAFNVQFLSTGDVALKVTTPLEGEKAVDAALRELKTPIGLAFTVQKFGSLQLARFDDSLNVLLRESDSTSEGGWSQVAAKAAAPKRTAVQPSLNVRQSSFTILGSLNATGSKPKKIEPKRKVVKEDVVDDWEVAEMEVEAKESSSANMTGVAVVQVADGPGATTTVVERAQDAAANVQIKASASEEVADSVKTAEDAQ
ncbi:hypothetical protein FH972_021002 [Carpinus fangiana]|uniref:R3H domain-containing protein n=1 Tax=Carpinus fangiana TaxID=176857 RepID=A0A5N6KN27_9ROSI|nr:hypothetical protein FH972_021002 [Carpinus fangiana]